MLEKKTDYLSLNSPVVEGNTLIGVIDKIEDKKSRVCMITNKSNAISIKLLSQDERSDLQVETKGTLKGLSKLNVFNGEVTLCAKIPCIKKKTNLSRGDLLVTTGKSPYQKLKVGIVSNIVKHGKAYNLEVTPACNNINNLYYVTVLSKTE